MSVAPDPAAGTRIRVRQVDPNLCARLEQAGLSPLMARLHATRGSQPEDIRRSRVSDLLPPVGLRGAREAASLLAEAIVHRRPIVIVGDYDCDGATGVAVGVLGLRQLGAVVDYVVPHRTEHGYGLSPAIVDWALQHPRLGRPEVLVTVDNGIASHAGVARARAAGLKVLVTDHHLPGDELPPADVIVNPNQPDCPFASKHLAGVGVLFYVLLATRAHLRAAGHYSGDGGRTEPALQTLLDLVALGTVADVARLDHNNRLLVAAGIKRLRAGLGRPGLMALLRTAGREARSLQCEDLGFVLGPRINAAGRLEDMSIGVECLLADAEDAADELAGRLDAINRERRDRQADMNAQALAAATADFDPRRLSLVAFEPGWHQGLVGLVASRLRERFARPAFAFAQDEPGSADGALLKGSGRSLPGLHLRDALDRIDRRHPGLILAFGGHAMAAGLTLEHSGLAAFTQALEAVVAEMADPALFAPEIETDGSLADHEMSLNTVAEIEAGVWGQGFPAPLFSDRFEVLAQRLIKSAHLKLELGWKGRRLPAIVFGRTDPLPREATLAFELQRDTWQDPPGVSLIVRHCER